jgi:hypothetical protein
MQYVIWILLFNRREVLVMRYSVIAVALLGVLAGCASVPNGPSVAVMPAPGESFDQFNADDNVCRQFAQKSIGTSANQASASSEAESIAIGTAIGVVAGALTGGQSGSGTGAAIGMLGGAAMGSDQAQNSGLEAQRRYDIAYEQCMYAKGNQLPQASVYLPRARPPAPAPSYYPPPPPPQ